MISVSKNENAPAIDRPSIFVKYIKSPSIPDISASAALSEKNKLTTAGSKTVLCKPVISTMKALPFNLS